MLKQMLEWLRRLLQPAPTSVFDPFRWRRDNRSVREKFKDGIRLAGGLVAGLFVLGLAFAGTSSLLVGSSAYGQYGLFASWTMVCASAIFLFLTANRWASVGFGIFCGPALIKSFAVLVFGGNPSSSVAYQRLTRAQAGEIFLLCIVVTALTWRFLGNRPAATTFVDRITLTVFAFAAIRQIVVPYKWPPIVLITGLAALLVAWCVYRWKRANRKRKHHPRDLATSETRTR